MHDFVVLEKADDLGGTWRDNTYPGCRCDVPSHLYSFSFAPNPTWSRTYSPQAEILAYLKSCADRFGVREKVRFGCDVTSAVWDAGRWKLETSQGAIEARVLILAAGPLSAPSVPSLPGLESFSGTTMHSAEWNHDQSLDWHLLDHPLHAALSLWLGDLNRTMRQNAALHARDFDTRGLEWIDASDAEQSVIAFLRRGLHDEPILVVCNMTPQVRYNYRVGVPGGGVWRSGPRYNGP